MCGRHVNKCTENISSEQKNQEKKDFHIKVYNLLLIVHLLYNGHVY